MVISVLLVLNLGPPRCMTNKEGRQEKVYYHQHHQNSVPTILRYVGYLNFVSPF